MISRWLGLKQSDVFRRSAANGVNVITEAESAVVCLYELRILESLTHWMAQTAGG